MHILKKYDYYWKFLNQSLVFAILLKFRIPVHAGGGTDQLPCAVHVASSSPLTGGKGNGTRTPVHSYWKLSPSVYLVGESGTSTALVPFSGGGQVATKYQLNNDYSLLCHIHTCQVKLWITKKLPDTFFSGLT